MQEKQTWNISIQNIDIFLKAAELKNFTQVAHCFNFTPSTVSKIISSMEDELEIKLFERSPYGPELTPAGEFLAHEWRQITGSFRSSIQKVLDYQKTQCHRITLGFVDSSPSVDCLITRALKEYSDINPDITVIAEKHDMHRAAELLNIGMLDVILTSNIETAYLDEHKLPWRKIYDTSSAVFVPGSNELFSCDSVSFSDLKNQTFLALDPVMHPTYNAWFFGLCKKYGFVPEIKATFRTVRSLMFSLGLYDSVFVGDSVTSDWCHDNLKMFLLPEKTFSVVAWKNTDAPYLSDFIDYIFTVSN